MGSKILFSNTIWKWPGEGTQRGWTAVEKVSQEDVPQMMEDTTRFWIVNESGEKQLDSRDIFELESAGLSDHGIRRMREG